MFGNQENKSEIENLRPINTGRAAGRFAATFLMPEAAVRTTVSRIGITADVWSWELLLRIKHRFGVSAQSFLYRLHELNLIESRLKDRLDAGINEFYESTGFKEPDSTKRCLTPNSRFFDLLLTAKNFNDAKEEIIEIKKMVKRLKILQK